MAEIVLITGASKGIGKATALYLANRDFTVYATSRKEDEIKKLVEDGKKTGKQIYGAVLEVTNAQSCEKLVNAIIKKEGKIDVLINNAGFGQYGPFEEISEEKLRAQMETNFFGAARMIRLVLPSMRQKENGLIINMSSVAGKIGFPLAAPYNSSKFAIEGLSEALRAELIQFNIHVVLVEPAYIMSDFGQTAEDMARTFIDNKESPYHKMVVRELNNWKKATGGKSEDVAEVIHQIIESETPKARYPVTSYAKQALLAKKFLPDSMFERIINKRNGEN